MAHSAANCDDSHAGSKRLPDVRSSTQEGAERNTGAGAGWPGIFRRRPSLIDTDAPDPGLHDRKSRQDWSDVQPLEIQIVPVDKGALARAAEAGRILVARNLVSAGLLRNWITMLTAGGGRRGAGSWSPAAVQPAQKWAGEEREDGDE
jgi:hypothetical protein